MRAYSLNQILLFSFGCAFVRLLMIAWGVGSLPVLLAAQLLHAITFGAFHAAGVALMHQIFRGRNQARGPGDLHQPGLRPGRHAGHADGGLLLGQPGFGLDFHIAAVRRCWR